MSNPIEITGLSAREEVIDAFNRVMIGLDDSNLEFFNSAVVQNDDTKLVIGDKTTQGYEAIRDYMVNRIFPLATTHNLSNFRVNFINDSLAQVRANAIAFHSKSEKAIFQADNEPFVTGAVYLVDVVKDEADGLWKFKQWDLKIHWTTGDPKIVLG